MPTSSSTSVDIILDEVEYTIKGEEKEEDSDDDDVTIVYPYALFIRLGQEGRYPTKTYCLGDSTNFIKAYSALPKKEYIFPYSRQT